MSIKNGTTLTPEALSYLVGLIRDISGLDTKLIDDLNIKSNGSYSSLKISQLVDQALKDSKEYSDLLCSSLIKLTCEKTTTQPTLSNSEKNVIYLYSADGNAPFDQYLKISDTELIDMGSTSISLNDYLTITDAVATYCKKTDFDALKTEVDKVKTKVGTDTLNTTSQTVTGAINELENKSTMVTLTQAEYNQLVADGTVDADTYYIISDDSENIEITQTISSSSTKNEVPSALATFNLLKTVYPVGSIYINTTDVNPSTIFGFGTWERVAQNMTLWGSSADGEVGTTKSAGLPNITGQFGACVPTGHTRYASGAFSAISMGAIGNSTNGGTDGNVYGFAINASKSSSIYGNSTTVQPPALVVNIWKRTA